MKQLKVSLPDDLRTQLDVASAKNDRSVGEEIRDRISAAFVQEAVDKPTRELVQGIVGMAAEIECETGAAWHKHAGAHETLTRAILKRLEVLKPKGSTAFGDRPHATTDEADPNQLGTIIEFRLRRYPDFTNSPTRAFMEEEYQRSRSDPDVVARVAALNRVLLDTPLKPKQQKKGGK